MPAVSERQRRWAGAQLGGKNTSGMSREKLRHFAMKPKKKIRPGAGSKGKASDQYKALKY